MAAKKKTAKKGAKRSKAKRKSAASGRKRPKRGFKLSVATKRKIGAKSRAHWKSITGNGTPKNHIPLAQLKKNHKRLGDTIAKREKNPSAWK